MQSVISTYLTRVSKNKLSLIFISLMLFAAYICFFQLGKSALENWDEAWYGDILRNMVRTGNLAVPYWNRTLLLDKPPLQMWLSLPYALIFGTNEFSVRVVSALAGFLTIVSVTGYAFKKWGIIPAILAFLTIVLNNMFIWRVRSGNLDALLTFLVLAVFLLSQSKWKYKYPVLGFIFSLIYLTKASIVTYPLVIFVLGELIFERKFFTKNIKQYVFMIVAMVLLPMTWLIAGYVKVGWPFVHYYLFSSDQGVSSIALKYFKIDYLQYLYYSLQRRFTYLFIASLIAGIFSLRKKEIFSIVCYSLFLLILLTFTERSNNWYLLPSVPFWSLVMAYGTHGLISYGRHKKVFLYPFVGGLLVLSAYISFKTYTVNIRPIIDASGPQDQKAIGLHLRNSSRQEDVIIRTNDSYPATVFYADRKVLTYKPEIMQTHATFIGDRDLTECLNKKTCPYMTGPENDTSNLIQKLGQSYKWEQQYKSGQEVIMRLK